LLRDTRDDSSREQVRKQHRERTQQHRNQARDVNRQHRAAIRKIFERRMNEQIFVVVDDPRNVITIVRIFPNDAGKI
jgi:hypothetical protein